MLTTKEGTLTPFVAGREQLGAWNVSKALLTKANASPALKSPWCRYMTLTAEPIPAYRDAKFLSIAIFSLFLKLGGRSRGLRVPIKWWKCEVRALIIQEWWRPIAKMLGSAFAKCPIKLWMLSVRYVILLTDSWFKTSSAIYFKASLAFLCHKVLIGTCRGLFSMIESTSRLTSIRVMPKF